MAIGLSWTRAENAARSACPRSLTLTPLLPYPRLARSPGALPSKVAPPFAIFRRISQNFSPAGVTSPCFARAMPIENTSVVPASGR